MRADSGFWIAWSRVTGVGSVRLRRLWEYFGDLELAWRADLGELQRAGLDSRCAAAAVAERPFLHPEREMEAVSKAGILVITVADSCYPVLLRTVDGAPALLHVLGSLQPADELALAVVGNRSVTAYGRQVTEYLVSELVLHGLTIVSGLARGVDAIAHRTALAAQKRTLAVLGSGLDCIYPPEHGALAREIAQSGALVSEFPLGTKPDAPNFPMRNRVIAALSLGTLVVEAGESSGALITAARALEQNREVFAIPGSIFAPHSKGTNTLIRRGEAKLVSTAADILEELRVEQLPQQLTLETVLAHDGTEQLLLQHLSQEPSHVDALTRLTNLPISVVSSTLAMLELRGVVRQVSVMQYVRAR